MFPAESCPIPREHMMTPPERVPVKHRVQISDDGERMKIALKSLKQENNRLSDLIALLSERVILPFPRTSSAAAAARELRGRDARPLWQYLVLACRDAAPCSPKRSTAPLERAATPLTAHYLPIGAPISGKYSRPNAPPDRNTEAARTSSSTTVKVIGPAPPSPCLFDHHL